MENILQLRNVRYRYNGKEVLAVSNLNIARGSITGLAGPNGSGKSTLLKLLACIEEPTNGSLTYSNGNDLARKNAVRQNLSLLPQETYLLQRSVFENICYGLKIRGKGSGQESTVNDALQLVGLEPSFARRQWHELSGGEAQRVALAARLILKPDCLMLDEPTASVDMESARCIRRAVLLARKEWGTTLVIASHHRSWLNDICDRIVYLYNGQMLDCSYENILTGPWENADDSMVACTLSDGQKVFVTKPPSADCSAVISSRKLEVHRHPPSDRNKLFLQGIVSSVTLENHSGSQLHVTCGDQRFVVSISAQFLEEEKFRPGLEVSLLYRPDAITWLEK